MTKDELAGLEERLRSRSWSDSQDALADAVARGKQAEPLLVQLLTESDRYRAPAVAAAVGDMRGPGPADAVLRSLVERTGPGTDDQRCASLLALAKRLGRAATDDYLQALARGSAALKDYALLCLAAAGDGRGWDQVFVYLSNRLRGRRSSTVSDDPSPTVVAIDYLVRHVGDSVARREQLVSLLVERWDRLPEDDRAWLAQSWPDLNPGPLRAASVSLPPRNTLIDWADRALFSAPAIVRRNKRSEEHLAKRFKVRPRDE